MTVISSPQYLRRRGSLFEAPSWMLKKSLQWTPSAKLIGSRVNSMTFPGSTVTTHS